MHAHSHCRLLIVEDDPSVAQFMAMVLSDEGYEVAVASTGEEALQLLESARPDLVLLDMILPAMQGAAVLEEMRRRAGPDLPLIVMTAKREGGVPVEEMGAQGLLEKPFDLGELLEQVQRVVGRACPV